MSRGKVHLIAATVAALILLGTTACGVSESGRATAAPPIATHTARTSPTPLTTVASGGTITQDHVTVTLAKSLYASSDTITVYINNGLNETIRVANHQTECTIVTLQQLQGGAWQGVAPCRLMIVTILRQISAHTTIEVRLTPAAAQVARALWQAGAYRISLVYVTTTPEQLSPVYSALFEIR